MKSIYSSAIKMLFVFSLGYMVACTSTQPYDEELTDAAAEAESEVNEMADQYDYDEYEDRADEGYDYQENQLVYENYTAGDLENLKNFYFGFDRYDLSDLAANALPYHAELVKEKIQQDPGYLLVIEGHTDERGTPEYNIALGLKRAEAVSRYLRVHGVPADHIRTVSYGEERPAVFGYGEEVWSKNRRAQVVH